MPNDRVLEFGTKKRKGWRGRKNRSSFKAASDNDFLTPVQILDQLLELIPVNSKLPISQPDLVLLYHVVGRKIDRSMEARQLVEQIFERFNLEEETGANPRRPGWVLGILLSRIPAFTGFGITAEELRRLEHAVGKTALTLDTTDQETARPLNVAELVKLEFGEVTTKEAASLAGVSHRSILREVQEGKLRGRRQGGRYRFVDARSLRNYLERQGRIQTLENDDS